MCDRLRRIEAHVAWLDDSMSQHPVDICNLKLMGRRQDSDLLHHISQSGDIRPECIYNDLYKLFKNYFLSKMML